MMMMMMTNMRAASRMCAGSFAGLEESLGLKDFPNRTEKSCELVEIKVQFTAKTDKVKLL